MIFSKNILNFKSNKPIYDLGKPLPLNLKMTNSPKCALLSYITMPFRLSKTDPRLKQFSNAGMARCMVQALNELGYIVDVIEWSDNKFLPNKHYDLFIGHGGINFERICRNLSPKTVTIYFSTGLYWRLHNEKELKRFSDLEKRRSMRLGPDRLIKVSEEWANTNADAIICIGNENVKISYSKFDNVISINNATYYDSYYDNAKQDFNFKKNNFLFFSGSGSVHKGLDLLLEAFTMLDANLWICQNIDKNFYKVYSHELDDYPNIRLVGWVPLRSDQFYNIIDKCGYVIFPSCSEGQPGSVIECMNQGLIPVVSKESNINVKGFGILIETCTVEEIRNYVYTLSRRPSHWVKTMSLMTREAVKREYLHTVFIENFKKAVETVVNNETNFYR